MRRSRRPARGPGASGPARRAAGPARGPLRRLARRARERRALQRHALPRDAQVRADGRVARRHDRRRRAVEPVLHGRARGAHERVLGARARRRARELALDALGEHVGEHKPAREHVAVRDAQERPQPRQRLRELALDARVGVLAGGPLSRKAGGARARGLRLRREDRAHRRVEARAQRAVHPLAVVRRRGRRVPTLHHRALRARARLEERHGLGVPLAAREHVAQQQQEVRRGQMLGAQRGLVRGVHPARELQRRVGVVHRQQRLQHARVLRPPLARVYTQRRGRAARVPAARDDGRVGVAPRADLAPRVRRTRQGGRVLGRGDERPQAAGAGDERAAVAAAGDRLALVEAAEAARARCKCHSAGAKALKSDLQMRTRLETTREFAKRAARELAATPARELAVRPNLASILHFEPGLRRSAIDGHGTRGRGRRSLL